MDGSLTASFWAVSMLFVLTPGVDWAYAVTSGLRRGGTVPAVSGMLLGHFAATLIVAAGVAALVSASEIIMVGLTLLGALYLIWLGLSAVRHPAVAPPVSEPVEAHGPGGGAAKTSADPARDAAAEGETTAQVSRRLFAKGLGVSLLNPKVFLLFLALLPQFTSATASWPAGCQILVLGAVHVANCAVVYFAVGAGAGKVLRTRPRAASVVGLLSGMVMILLGVGLIIEKIVALA